MSSNMVRGLLSLVSCIVGSDRLNSSADPFSEAKVSSDGACKMAFMIMEPSLFGRGLEAALMESMAFAFSFPFLVGDAGKEAAEGGPSSPRVFLFFLVEVESGKEEVCSATIDCRDGRSGDAWSSAISKDELAPFLGKESVPNVSSSEETSWTSMETWRVKREGGMDGEL